MSELTKNVQPLQDFDWEQFENGTTANVSKEELDKAYNETLNKVSEHQVVDGKVISVDKKEVVTLLRYTLRTQKTRKVSLCCHTKRPACLSLGSVSMPHWKVRKSSMVTSSAARRVA